MVSKAKMQVSSTMIGFLPALLAPLIKSDFQLSPFPGRGACGRRLEEAGTVGFLNEKLLHKFGRLTANANAAGYTWRSARLWQSKATVMAIASTPGYAAR